jgi:hypothetical protein
MTTILEMLHLKKIVDEEACKTMIAILKTNEDKEMLARYLPENTTLAHKSGAVSNCRTDAGLLYVKDQSKKEHVLAICVLTNDNDDKRYVINNEAHVLIANVAREVYQFYSNKK